MIIWSVYSYIFCRLRTAIFVPRGKRSDWIFINVFFFLLIYRKQKFCAEPMRERLTFHFELRTRSVNFRFFVFLFFFSFFLFFQIKARSRLVTICIQEHRYTHTEDIKYHDSGNGWMLATVSAWKNSVNAAVGGVGMLIGPRALKTLNSIERIQPRMMAATFIGNPRATIISC